MIPRFSSQVDMMSFIKALPKNANYSNMLREDFGIVAPDEAPAYQKEYLWKYLVQGKFLGKPEAELIKYAVEGTEKLAKTLPHITVKEIYAEGNTQSTVTKEQKLTRAPGKGKHVYEKQPDGTIEFAAHRKVYVGWLGGKIVYTASTAEKCKKGMTKKFSITEFTNKGF